MDFLGDYGTSDTVYVYFSTNAADGSAVAPSSAFETSDFRIYKNGSNTQRASASGWTVTSPFDSVTGLHLFAIDLNDNTDSGFYAPGNVYTSILVPDDETVDSVSVVAPLAQFTILKTTALRPTTAGRTLVVDASGLADANTVKVGPSGSGTAQSAGDLSAKLDTIDDFIDTEVSAIKAKTDNLPASPAAVGDIPTAIQNADALLDRDMSVGTDSGSTTVRTVRQALRVLRNKISIVTGTLTVNKEDDSTASWTAAVTGTPGADPITAVDPAGP